MKLVPFTRRICTCEPAAICVGLRAVILGTGLFIPPPPPPPLLPPPQLSRTKASPISVDAATTRLARRRGKRNPTRHAPRSINGAVIGHVSAEMALAFDAAFL